MSANPTVTGSVARAWHELAAPPASEDREQLGSDDAGVVTHPVSVSFRDGPAGRRAHLVGGPDVWEFIDGLVGGDIPADERISRAVDVFGLPRPLVEAALTEYAEFTDEVDAQLECNRDSAERAEAQWRRQQDLLAR